MGKRAVLVAHESRRAGTPKTLRSFLPPVELWLHVLDVAVGTDAVGDEPLERYIETHFEKLVTHSICPDCYVEHVQPQLDRREERL